MTEVDSFTFYKWTIYFTGSFLIIASIYLLYLYFLKNKDNKYIYVAATLNSLGFLFLYLESKVGSNKMLQYTLLITLIIFFILYTIITILGTGDLFHSVQNIRYDPVSNLETHDTNIRFTSSFSPLTNPPPGTYLGYGYKEDGSTESFHSDILNVAPTEDNGGFNFLTATAGSTFIPNTILRINKDGVTFNNSGENAAVRFGSETTAPQLTAISNSKGSHKPPFNGFFFTHTYCEKVGHDVALILHAKDTKVYALNNHIHFQDGEIRHFHYNQSPVEMTTWCFSH